MTEPGGRRAGHRRLTAKPAVTWSAWLGVRGLEKGVQPDACLLRGAWLRMGRRAAHGVSRVEIGESAKASEPGTLAFVAVSGVRSNLRKAFFMGQRSGSLTTPSSGAAGRERRLRARRREAKARHLPGSAVEQVP